MASPPVKKKKKTPSPQKPVGGRGQRRKKKTPSRSFWSSFFSVLWQILVFLMKPWRFFLFALACFCLFCAGYGVYTFQGLPKEEERLAKLTTPISILYLDRHGRPLAPGSTPVTLDSMSSSFIRAVLAVEDRRFYTHHGVDVKGIARAAVANMRAGRTVQGGSTITQQLARRLFLSTDRTLRRKLQEAWLAYWLEQRLSKDDILELYLNRVYFGAGAWGAEAAAQRYFDKSVRFVSPGEAALLAGLLQAPSRYNPAADPEQAITRTNTVLAAMVGAGFLSPEERQKIFRKPIEVFTHARHDSVNYFLDWVSPFVQNYAGAKTSRLTVKTTLDMEMQASAQHALSKAFQEGAESQGVDQGALLALDGSGAVLAMLGGRSYRQSAFNRAVYAKRQSGSAFKPFVYLTAMEKGISPWAEREDRPVSLGGWSPKNYTHHYFGKIALAGAFARSLNTTTVLLGEEVGRNNIIKTARRLGYSSPLKPHRSLSLGTHETTLLDITGAYVPFANGGKRIEPYGILSITTDANTLLFQADPQKDPVISDAGLKRMTVLMTRAVSQGTGRRARLPGRMVGGKTGTTNGYRDAWFIGYADNFVAGVWLGRDKGGSMDKVTGGNWPARIWHNFARNSLKTTPSKPLPLPYTPPIPFHKKPSQKDAGVFKKNDKNSPENTEPPALPGFLEELDESISP